MNRIFKFLIFILVITALITPFSALAYDHVTDREIMLEPYQLNILETRCNLLSEDDFGLIICIEDSADVGLRISELAGSSGFNNGAVYFANSTKAVSYFSPFGKETSEVFTEEVCAQIEEIANNKISNVGYYDGCRSVIANVEAVLGGDSPTNNGSFYMPSVIDEAGFLSTDEQAEISERLDSVREKYKTDVSVVIEREMSSNDAAVTAADIYDYNFYGYGEESQGIMLYISKNPRKYHFTFCPSYHEAFEGEAIAYLDEKVLPYLKDDDYYGALMQYADVVESLLSDNADGIAFSNPDEELTASDIAIFSALVALIVALIATFVKGRKMNTAITQSYASNYIKEGSFNLNVSNDIFMYSRIDKRAKPKQNTSTKSSSGRSHGGRGGSY